MHMMAAMENIELWNDFLTDTYSDWRSSPFDANDSLANQEINNCPIQTGVHRKPFTGFHQKGLHRF
jgi:hypothetical protein